MKLNLVAVLAVFAVLLPGALTQASLSGSASIDTPAAENCTLFPYRALYDPAADIPGQRAMLDQFYNSTGGATWFYLSVSDNFRSQVAGLRDYVAAYQLAALTQNQTALQTYPPAVAQVLGQVSNGCTLQQELQLAQLTLKYPWYTPGTSYCQWFGVLCCLTIDISYAAFCTQGSQSVAGIRVTGANLTGTLPPHMFDAFVDLQLLYLDSNAGLQGPVPPMPDSLAAKIQSINLAGTSLRMPCPLVNAQGTQATDSDVCLPNFMQACNMISLLGRPGFICPSIALRRPVSPISAYLAQTVSLTIQQIRNVTASNDLAALPPALNYSTDVQLFLDRLANESQFTGCPQGSSPQRYGPALSAPLLVPSTVTVDPDLYGYAGCSCDTGYDMVSQTEPNGSSCMSCTPKNSGGVPVAAILIPTVIVGTASILAGCWLILNRRRIMQEIETFKVNCLKKRNPPGTLGKGVGKSVGLVFQEITLVMTDVQGSTELWEWNAEVMNKALSMHDETLRTLLPLYSGFEVTTEGDAFTMAFHDPIDAIGWALHVQHQLLTLEWPTELLSHPVASQELVLTSSGDNVLFRGLRVRMGINTGKPASIQVQPVTKQLEYIGEVVRCTEAIVNLPAGGQVLMGAATFLRTNGRLHQLALPSELCAGPSGIFSQDLEPDIALDMARRTQQDLGEPATIERQSSPGEFSIVAQSEMMRDTADEGDDASLTNTDIFSVETRPAARLTPWQRVCRFCRQLWHRCMRLERSHTDASAEELNMALGLVPKLLQRMTTLTRSDEVMPVKKQTCMIMDMGVFLFPDLLRTTFLGGSAVFGGTHIIQVLPVPLAFRAMQFAPLDPDHQLAPSFMDAPGATHVWLPGKPDLLALEKPNVVIAFASTVGLKDLTASSSRLAETALQMFKSCVRTTLLLLDGYECQEKDGGFMLAFSNARAALEWAVSLQLSLIRQPWHEQLQRFQMTRDMLSSDGKLLSRGLPAKISVFQGEITKVCPHTVTGRADYFGSTVNRSARLLAGAQAGQILVEEGLVREVMLAWSRADPQPPHQPSRSQDLLKPAAMASHMAVKNCQLLSGLTRKMRDQAPAVDIEDVPPDSGHVAHERVEQQQPARQPEENTAKLIASGSQATEQPSSESKQSALVTVRGSALGDSSPLQPNAALSGSTPGLAQGIGPAASLSSASLPAVLAQQLQPPAPSPSPSRQSFSQRVLGSHGSHSKPSRLSPRESAIQGFSSSSSQQEAQTGGEPAGATGHAHSQTRRANAFRRVPARSTSHSRKPSRHSSSMNLSLPSHSEPQERKPSSGCTSIGGNLMSLIRKETWSKDREARASQKCPTEEEEQQRRIAQTSLEIQGWDSLSEPVGLSQAAWALNTWHPGIERNGIMGESKHHDSDAEARGLHDFPHSKLDGKAQKDGKGAVPLSMDACRLESITSRKTSFPRKNASFSLHEDPSYPGYKAQVSTVALDIEVWTMGDFIFKGVEGPCAIAQVFPSSLGPRMQKYVKMPHKGKAFVPTRTESQCLFRGPVSLIDIFQMPLTTP